MTARKGNKRARPVVIRREEIVAAPHHSGAWKVAYADFVTAMMAFFLLMWLINATTEKQRRGLADYFSPTGPKTRATSGSGKPFGGLTPLEVGSLVSNRGFLNNTDQTGRPPPAESPALDTPPLAAQPSSAPSPTPNPDQNANGHNGVSNQVGVANFAAPQTDPDAVPIDGDSNQPGASGHSDATEDSDTESGGGPAGPDNDTQTRAASTDTPTAPPPSPAHAPQRLPATTTPTLDPDPTATRFEHAAAALKRALAADPATRDAARQVGIDASPDELRIQIFDREGKPMFAPGSAAPNARARELLREIAPVLAHLHEPISIVGHTDATVCPAPCRSNWDLSAARADATRATLVAAGLDDRRIAGVAGLADHDLLLPAQPDAPANRRVVMIVHRPLPALDHADHADNAGQ